MTPASPNGGTPPSPSRGSRFGRTARLDAQVAEILPLDRFGGATPSDYREGPLGLTTAHQDADIQVRQGADMTAFEVVMTNLTPYNVTFRAQLPSGLSPSNGRAPEPVATKGSEVSLESRLTDARESARRRFDLAPH